MVFPLGHDFGPAVPGYGDMLKSCDNETWDKLSDFGFDYNWNIQLYVEDVAGNEIQIVNGNIYTPTGKLFQFSESYIKGDLEKDMEQGRSFIQKGYHPIYQRQKGLYSYDNLVQICEIHL